MIHFPKASESQKHENSLKMFLVVTVLMPMECSFLKGMGKAPNH